MPFRTLLDHEWYMTPALKEIAVEPPVTTSSILLCVRTKNMCIEEIYIFLFKITEISLQQEQNEN